METMNQRIKFLRKKLCLNQAKFGESIGLTQGGVSWLEIDGNTVTEQKLRLICERYQINETWLRTGEGVPSRTGNEIEVEEMNTLVSKYHLSKNEVALLKSFLVMPQIERQSILKFIARASQAMTVETEEKA